MPAWQFGHQRQCWQEAVVKTAPKIGYRKMESDMHNLQPAVGEVNGDRGNFMYSQWNGGEGQYGQCTMKVDFKDKIAEPLPALAAPSPAYFYMRDRYQLNLSASKLSCLPHGINSTRSPHGNVNVMSASRKCRTIIRMSSRLAGRKELTYTSGNC